MELLDRYLNAVKFWLPKPQRQDIIAELSEDIRSEVEEREAGLGRRLSDDELAAILKRRGSPFAAAQRFLPERHLIGPGLFPIYLFVLKLVAFFYLVPWLAVWACLVLFVPSYRTSHPGAALIGTLGTLWQIALFAFAAVTIGFAGAERIGQRSVRRENWDPRRLPRVRDRRRILRSSSAAEIVFGIIFLFFWLGALRFPAISAAHLAAASPASEPAPISLGPVWESFRTGYYWPVAALAALGVVLASFNLFRPYWTRARLGLRAAIDAAGAAILAVVLAGHWTEVRAEWLGITGPRPAGTGIELARIWINVSLSGTLLVAALICAAECLIYVRRMFRMDKTRERSRIGGE
jgi:hypothetical protein